MADQPAQAAPAQPAPPQVIHIPANQRTPMNNQEDAQYLLEFHREYEQKLSKILLKAGKDYEQLIIKVAGDIDRLSYVMHESTVSRQPPLWDSLFDEEDGDDDDEDGSDDDGPAVGPIANPNVQPPTSSIRDQRASGSPMAADEELQITLAMINKVSGVTNTLAETEASNIFLKHATSLRTHAESSNSQSLEAANALPASCLPPNTDVERSVTPPAEDIEVANILLRLSTANANTDIVGTAAAVPEAQKEVEVLTAPKGKQKATTTTRKRKAAVMVEYKDSDYPHHIHEGRPGCDPLGISDLSKAPAQVMEDNDPPARRTRTRR